MTFHGENGECFVRLNGGQSLTLGVNTAGELQFHIKKYISVYGVKLFVWPDDGGASEYNVSSVSEEGMYNIHSFFLSFEKDALMFFRIEVITPDGKFFAACNYGSGVLSRSPEEAMQLLVYDRKYDAPKWLEGGVFYHIFIDRFAKGGDVPVSDDAIMLSDWDNGIPEYNDGKHKFINNTFFGGTLYGAADKLDYLSALGVTCVYLSPCFESVSNHKYDTSDYMKVDPMFGGDEALALFIKEADKRGISVILDGVFNHVGADSVYFNRYGRYGNVGACQDKNSPYFDWFNFYSYPDKYEAWWDFENLPRTKRTEGYMSFICDEVIPKYMNMGIKGFRLDVVDELEGFFLDRITAAVKKCRHDGIVLGEVWEDASCKVAYGERKRYFRGSQLDSVMNYPLRSGITDFLISGNSALLKDTVTTLLKHYPAEQLNCTMNLLGTHDTERIITVLGNENTLGLDDNALAVKRMPYELKCLATKRVEEAYTILAFMPGVPCIYYGDECGLEGHHDPFCRRPFPWNNGDGRLRKRFARMNALRASEKVFAEGDCHVLHTDDESFAVLRTLGEETLLLLSNQGRSEKVMFDIEVPPDHTAIYKKREGSWYQML